MTYRGLAKGKIVELDEPLPYPVGQPVYVSIQPAPSSNVIERGRPEDVLRAMKAPPHLTADDVDELDCSIEAGKTNGR